jgi:hypothetical protein
VRGLPLALALVACASTSTEQRPFSWLEGCWRAGDVEIVWRIEGASWIGDAEGLPYAFCARGVVGGCRYRLQRDDDGGWTLRDEITGDVRIYSLEESTGHRARFRAVGHPLRARPDVWLILAASERELEMTLEGQGVLYIGSDEARTSFKGVRC